MSWTTSSISGADFLGPSPDQDWASSRGFTWEVLKIMVPGRVFFFGFPFAKQRESSLIHKCSCGLDWWLGDLNLWLLHWANGKPPRNLQTTNPNNRLEGTIGLFCLLMSWTDSGAPDQREEQDPKAARGRQLGPRCLGGRPADE